MHESVIIRVIRGKIFLCVTLCPLWCTPPKNADLLTANSKNVWLQYETFLSLQCR